jgi:hypothetical protein
VITVTEHLAYLFAVSILIVLPLVATIFKGVEGAIVSGIIILFTSPFTVQIFRSVKSVSFPRFILASRQLLGTKLFKFSLLTILNVWLVLKVGLQTLIPFYSLLTFFLITSTIGFLLTHYWVKVKSRRQSVLISMGLIPLLINLFFLINFLFSFNPFTEKYLFTKSYEKTGSRVGKSGYRSSIQPTTSIMLEENKYADYPGIRTFLDYESMKNATSITYTFRKGLFGILVVTQFKFK